MKETDKTQFSFSLDKTEKANLEAAAKEMGITFTDLLKTGAAFYSSFDSNFWQKIKRFSKNLGIQEYLVLQNLAISWLARREAEAEILAGEAESILLEFQFTENGPLTGDELHANLKKDFIRSFENQKENAIRFGIEHGVPISEEDKTWLEKREPRQKKEILKK